MTLRPPKSILDLVTAGICCLAIVIFSAYGTSSHPPQLHAPSLQTVASVSDHGDHTHDDLGDEAAPEHHHADHTHEKAGFLTAFADAGRLSVNLSFLIASDHVDGDLRDRLERPPRNV